MRGKGGKARKGIKMSEKDVFIQNVSDEEMEAVAGGTGDERFECDVYTTRDIYNHAFPNCAATVERDSWCSDNDACWDQSVQYRNMKECHKAWD